MKNIEIPRISRPIPHQSESPGAIRRKSVTIPDVISDHPIVLRELMGQVGCHCGWLFPNRSGSRG